jgi:hypothetical protein
MKWGKVGRFGEAAEAVGRIGEDCQKKGEQFLAQRLFK